VLRTPHPQQQQQQQQRIYGIYVYANPGLLRPDFLGPLLETALFRRPAHLCEEGQHRLPSREKWEPVPGMQAPDCKRDPASFADKFSHATSLGHEDNQAFWDYKNKCYVPEHQSCYDAILAKASSSQWGHLKGDVWDEDMIHRHCLGQHNIEKKAWQCFEEAMTHFEKLGVAALTEEDVEVAKTGGIIYVHNKDKHQRPVVFVKLNRFQRELAADCLIYYLNHDELGLAYLMSLRVGK
jgi:hypothetical protein